MWRARGSAGILLVATLTACGGAPLPAPPSPTATPRTAAASTEPAPGSATAPAPTERPTPTVRPSPTPSLCPRAADAAAGSTQVVKGTANIFGAGHELAPQPGGGGAGQLPVLWSLPPGAGRVVTITCAAGQVIPRLSDGIANGPGGDGYGPTDVQSYGGISGIVNAHNGMFLVGVFLTDAVPTDPAPERLDFTDGEDFTELAPEIAQIFFIGDGVGRRYVVPADATRLFLGFADAAAYQGQPGFYDNNGGHLEVTVVVAPR